MQNTQKLEYSVDAAPLGARSLAGDAMLLRNADPPRDPLTGPTNVINLLIARSLSYRGDRI